MAPKQRKAVSAGTAEAAPAKHVPAVIATHVQRVHDDMQTVLDHPVFHGIRDADPLTISQG